MHKYIKQNNYTKSNIQLLNAYPGQRDAKLLTWIISFNSVNEPYGIGIIISSSVEIRKLRL